MNNRFHQSDHFNLILQKKKIMNTYRWQTTLNTLNRLRKYSTIKNQNDLDISKLRNIGILAHIDAGLTFLQYLLTNLNNFSFFR